MSHLCHRSNCLRSTTIYLTASSRIAEGAVLQKTVYDAAVLMHRWNLRWLRIGPQFTLTNIILCWWVYSVHARYWNRLACLSWQRLIARVVLSRRSWLLLLDPILVCESNHLGADLLITHWSLLGSIQILNTLFRSQTVLIILIFLRVWTCRFTDNSCLIISLTFLRWWLRMAAALCTSWWIWASCYSMNGTTVHTSVHKQWLLESN